MKNLLIASTALVAFAGAAAAEVTVSGQGRFGVVAANGSNVTPYALNSAGNLAAPLLGAEVAFSSRLRVIFGMSFESDSGLTFGGQTRADNAAAANNGLAGSVFVSGDFGKLQVGDVDSGAKAAIGNISGIGYTGVGDYNEMFYILGGGGDPLANNELTLYADPAVLYTYSTGDLSFYVGLGNPSGLRGTIAAGRTLPSGRVTTVAETIEASEQYSVGVEWANEQFSAGIGYESTSIENITNAPGVADTFGAFYLGGSATFGGAVIKAVYGDITDLDYSQYGMSIDYTFDAFTATAYFRTADYGDDDLAVATDVFGTRTAYGFGGTYDLGGGVLVKGGIADPDLPDAFWQADLGVTFNF